MDTICFEECDLIMHCDKAASMDTCAKESHIFRGEGKRLLKRDVMIGADIVCLEDCSNSGVL